MAPISSSDRLEAIHGTLIALNSKVEVNTNILKRMDSLVTGGDDPSKGLIHDQQETRYRVETLERCEDRRKKMIGAAVGAAITSTIGAIIAWVKGS